jgi:hypothetical protein
MKFGCWWIVGGIKDVVTQEHSFHSGGLEIYFLGLMTPKSGNFRRDHQCVRKRGVRAHDMSTNSVSLSGYYDVLVVPNNIFSES